MVDIKNSESAAQRNSVGKQLSQREAIKNLPRPPFSTPKTNGTSSLAARESSPESAPQSPIAPSGLYTGSGKSRSSNSLSTKKKKFSLKNLKKSGPLLVFVLIIAGAGALFMGASSLLPAHIDENTQEAFDVQYGASKAAEIAVTEEALATGALPSGFANRLASCGIEVGYLDKNNNFIAGLRPTSENSIALASSSNSEKSTDNSLVLRFKDQIINSSQFGATLEADTELYSAFSDATYGRAINHYDDSANNFYKVIKSTRNVFKDYTTTGNTEEDTKKFRETFDKIFEGGADTSTATNLKGLIGEMTADTISDLANTFLPDSVANKVETFAYLATIYNSAKTPNEDDTAGNMIILVNNALNANETYHSMQYYLALEESISKMKAGEGSTSPINSVLNFLTTSTTSQIPDMKNGGFKEVTGAPVQSPTLSSVLTKNYGSNLSSEVSNYSSDRLITTADISSGGFLDMNKDNNGPIQRAPLSVTTNSSKIIKDFSYAIINDARELTNGVILKAVALLAPTVSQSILVSDNAEKTLSGIAAGEFFAKGGATLGHHIATFTQGGTIGSSEAIANYNTYTDKIIALDSAADRANRSPFDITSKNTFLGSIFASINNNLISSKSLLSTVSSISSLAGNSFLATIPGASAASTENSSYQTTYGNCPSLDQIHVKGDVFCNPIITFDTNTLSSAISSSEFNNYLNNNLTVKDSSASLLHNDSSVSINEEGDISKMLTYNNQRLSTFGIKDLATYNKSIEDGGFIKSFVNTLKSLGSKISSLFTTDTPNNYNDGEASIIATGEEFSNSPENRDKWNNNYKYAQAYITYERVLDQMEYYSEDNKNKTSLSQYFPAGSGTTISGTYLANFANQIENSSDAEYLAQISGMTESEAESVIAFVYYNSYLASINYDSYCSANDISCSTPEIPTFISFKDNSKVQKTSPAKPENSHHISRREEYYIS